MAQRRRVVVVLGMHRGGTSLMARGLQALGVELGGGLMPADAGNPTGYWENAAIVRFNDRLLGLQGVTWDAACVLPRAAFNPAQRNQARELLQAEFGELALCGFKDPRSSRLLGFWRPVFGDLGLDDSYVLVVRHPGEVLASLRARRDIGAAHGLLLCALHYLDALEGSAGRPCSLVDYDDLLAAPAAALRRIAGELALPLDAAALEAIEGYSRDFVDAGLRHHRRRAAGEAAEPICEAVMDLHRALRTVARGEATLASPLVAQAVDRMRRLIAGAAPLLEHAALGAGQAFPLAANGGAPHWGVRLDPRMPKALSAGEHVRVEVLCVNEGSRTWTLPRPEGPHLALAYHVRGRDGAMLLWDGERTKLTATVPPGGELRIQADFTAPDTAGDYYVEWDMVSEYECWFHETGCATASTPLRVTRPGEEEAGRYAVEVLPVFDWSPRFGKATADIRVAIAVRTWNAIRHGRRDLLERTLESLGEAGHPFELFLVDNGSTDGTAELVAARGGHAAPRIDGQNGAGHGMNIAIERALSCAPDLVVFSDDDIGWQPGFLRQLVQFWAYAPHDIAILSGYVEPRWSWNTIRGALDCGEVRAIVRETAPGGAWSFPAALWGRIGPLQPAMDADWEACQRLRSAGFRLCQADLALHLGAARSTWGNTLAAGQPVRAELFLRNP